ncbi:MAG: PAS domain S-box protein, partial [Gammaproteobacteria bacterium]|nr:PAS domain S-box protein [Gammaproteobacteria bacterium]NIT63343.1 PAS domain S-box protein [Gammaproteobacteria bacterium]NIV20266.1 PAS domain S-box protein [Gammaproteobacteria bacterium]NIY31923.1 PAS domain S-box protein [Gammaproteobacteria bacterium]
FRLVQFQPDGTPVYVSLNGTPRFDEAGGFLGYRGTGTNISEQVEAERALRRSEERYCRLVDLSPDGIMIHVQDRIVFANPAAVRLLGARRAHDLIGRDILDFVEPRFHKSAKLRMREALDKGRKQPQMEQILVGLDGRTFPAQCSATRLPREEGRAVLTVFRDITEVKQGEANLRRSP